MTEEKKPLPEFPRPPRKQSVLLLKLTFPLEYGLFLAFNLLDLFTTMLLIARGWLEANPLAAWFVHWGGKKTFIAYKIVLTLLVIALVEGVASRRPGTARILIWLGIVAVALIAISSAWRYYEHLATGF